MTVALDGEVVAVNQPVPSDKAKAYVVSTMKAKGAMFHSTQWQGWVPSGSSCPTGGDLGSSEFSVGNVRILGTLVQGTEPAKCS